MMTKQLYLSPWDWTMQLMDTELGCAFMAAHAIDEATAQTIDSAVKLVFQDDRLVETYDLARGVPSPRPLKEGEYGLAYADYPANRLLKLVPDADGLHQVGGPLPDGFQLPEATPVSSFQYLGYISNRDRCTDWLPFDFHLTCPIFLDIDKVFLDYADPQQPVLLNRDEVERLGSAYLDIKPDSAIIFDRQRFRFDETTNFSNESSAGVPHWLQYPVLPVCPKSGRIMRFLCQLTEGPNGGPKATSSNVVYTEEDMRPYLESMNFWGGGILYVFVEPTARTACYFIQNT